MIHNPKFPHVSIIILNWNGWEDTVECLESLYQMDYPNYDIILVDNASKDDSIIKIKEYCNGKLKVNSNYLEYKSTNKPITIIENTNNNIENNQNSKIDMDFLQIPSNKKLHLILNEKNYMFTKGNNIAINYIIKKIKTDYILLLNNDTIVENNLISELIEFFKDHPKIGIIGPNIYNYNDFEEKDLQEYNNINFPVEKDFVSGAALLIKIDLIHSIGLLDFRYIHYVEDKDYCYSARKAGYKVVFLPTKSKVLHKFGVSTRKVQGLKLYYKTRNTFLFKKKHLTNVQFLLFFTRFFTITFFMELMRYPKEKLYFLKGVKDGIKLVLKDKSLIIKR